MTKELHAALLINIWQPLKTFTKLTVCRSNMIVYLHVHRCLHVLCRYNQWCYMCMKIQQTWFLFSKTGQANFQLRHRLSSRQLFVASRGIPGSSGRQPFPCLLYGNRGQGMSDGFPQKLLCVDSLWGGVVFTPTASFLLGSDCQAYRTEGVYKKQGREVNVVMWKGVYILAQLLWMSGIVLHPLGFGGDEGGEHAGELGGGVYSLWKKLAAD